MSQVFLFIFLLIKQCFVYHFSDYPQKSYRVGTTWRWVNDFRIFILGWTIPAMHCKKWLRIKEQEYAWGSSDNVLFPPFWKVRSEHELIFPLLNFTLHGASWGVSASSGTAPREILDKKYRGMHITENTSQKYVLGFSLLITKAASLGYKGLQEQPLRYPRGMSY